MTAYSTVFNDQKSLPVDVQWCSVWTSLEPRKLFCHLLVDKGPCFRLVALLVPSSMLWLSLRENSLSFDSVHLPAFLPESSNLMIGGYQDSKAWYLWNKGCQKFSWQFVIKYIPVEAWYVLLRNFNSTSVRLSLMYSSLVSGNLTTSISPGSVDHPKGPNITDEKDTSLIAKHQG